MAKYVILNYCCLYFDLCSIPFNQHLIVLIFVCIFIHCSISARLKRSVIETWYVKILGIHGHASYHKSKFAALFTELIGLGCT